MNGTEGNNYYVGCALSLGNFTGSLKHVLSDGILIDYYHASSKYALLSLYFIL